VAPAVVHHDRGLMACRFTAGRFSIRVARYRSPIPLPTWILFAIPAVALAAYAVFVLIQEHRAQKAFRAKFDAEGTESRRPERRE
jgi:cytochrome c-type biogenesis protein CcmH/NrfF